MQVEAGEFMVVLVTAADRGEAEAIAEALLKDRLAACINIVPLAESIYLWKGQVERTQESLLVIKTSRELFPALAGRVKELHSYEVPEIIGLQLSDAAKGYQNYLRETLGQSG